LIVLGDTAAGEDELSGHEHHLVVALADQDFWNGAAAIDQDQCRRIPGAEIGMVIGFLALVDLCLLGCLRRTRHVLTQNRFLFILLTPAEYHQPGSRHTPACAEPMAI